MADAGPRRLRPGPWGRDYADRAEHPKFAAAGLEATGLWSMCNAWAIGNSGDDGFVPEQIALRFCDGGVRQMRRLAAKLTATAPGQRYPLWYAVDGGWTFHDWTEHQTPTSVRQKQRTAQAERQRRYEAKRASSDVPPDANLTRQVTHQCTPDSASLEREGESSSGLRPSEERESAAAADTFGEDPGAEQWQMRAAAWAEAAKGAGLSDYVATSAAGQVLAAVDEAVRGGEGIDGVLAALPEHARSLATNPRANPARLDIAMRRIQARRAERASEPHPQSQLRPQRHPLTPVWRPCATSLCAELRPEASADEIDDWAEAAARLDNDGVDRQRIEAGLRDALAQATSVLNLAVYVGFVDPLHAEVA